jgi:energy-coupling factor transporter ATP-binding protein EcfA2
LCSGENKNIKMETLNEKTIIKKELKLSELKELRAKMPKQNFLWKGVKQGAFGLIYGPSKSGKTIFCENLAFAICSNQQEFLGDKLNPINNKVLFIGLEEYWVNRLDRNTIQLNNYNENEKKLIEENFSSQQIDFESVIQTERQWMNLKNLINNSKAKTVFIDSITRMNHGSLEDSKTVEVIMQKLRTIAQNSGINLFCIHHTPKIGNAELTMNNIKGSAVFSQESDFALGINRTSKNNRYLKEVFYRYADDNLETVIEINFNESLTFDYVNDVEESEILNRTDRRRLSNKSDDIITYFNANPTVTHKISDLVTYFTVKLDIKKRMVEHYLNELIKSKKIKSLSRGEYCSIKYEFKSNETN